MASGRTFIVNPCAGPVGVAEQEGNLDSARNILEMPKSVGNTQPACPYRSLYRGLNCRDASRDVALARSATNHHLPPPPPSGSCCNPPLLATIDHNSNKHYGRTQELAVWEAFTRGGRGQSQEKSHAIPPRIPRGLGIHAFVGLQTGDERRSDSGEPGTERA